MKVKLPFSPHAEELFMAYLFNVYGYSINECHRIVDYINLHPSSFSLCRAYRRTSSSRTLSWNVFYKGNAVDIVKLLDFIKNDCLPF